MSPQGASAKRLKNLKLDFLQPKAARLATTLRAADKK